MEEETTEVIRGNVKVVIQENRVNVFVTLDSGATTGTTISRETGKVETCG
jgi:hypothetical protein